VNNQEARFILSAYRPSGEDASGAQFKAALQQVSRDPGLAHWFADQLTVDAATSEAVCSIPVPADLRGNILAGAKVSRRHLWFVRPKLLAMAAAILVLAGLAGFWTRQSRLESWQRDALAFVPTLAAGQSQFDHMANDGRALQQWLEAQNSPTAEVMPVALETLPAVGCKTISSNGKLVSITCFRLHGDELVHLVVTNASGANHAGPREPRFAKENGWTTASWTQNGRDCMLATKAPEQELRQLLTTTAQAANHRVDCCVVKTASKFVEALVQAA
jgi:hypothetical protein